MTDELVQFLDARIGEDEQAARAAMESHPVLGGADSVRAVWYRHDTGWVPSAHGEWAAGQALLDRFSPARVLADCEARRRVVETFAAAAQEHRCGTDELFFGETLRFLAQPYADHPDFREEWKL